ncbi:putative NAD(P)H-dependent FMN-containing oxidoreductase YwqN [Lachnospiraceae bacterium]|nr:putative NAD(P)H-dependent FMN-containing oxidoreductase YwqN [Lachnospiraceae bacterium]
MSILFINASPNKEGNTARLASKLLSGKEYETLNLIDYKIYAYGQNYSDDQFDEVIEKIRKADTIVVGSLLYWHNICGLLRNFLDRCYGPVRQGEFSGKNLYFIMQGASPEKWQLEACEFTMSRYAGLYGFDYKGMVTNSKEAELKQL